MTIATIKYLNDDSPIRHNAYVRMDVKYPTEMRVNTCCETYKGLYEMAREFCKGIDIMNGEYTKTISKERIENYMDFLKYLIIDLYEEKKHYERNWV